MTPFAQTSVRASTIRHHTDRGPATTAYIARLRPDRPDLRKHHKQLSDNWLLSTYIDARIKKAIIQAAAEVAGLQLGRDIIVEF